MAADPAEPSPSILLDRLLVQAVQASPAGTVVADAGQRILYVNAAFSAITGYSGEEMVGRNCRMLQGWQTDPSTVAAMRDALRSGRPFQGEILNYRRDGSPFWNDLAVTPITDAAGVVVGYSSVHLDATERVHQGRLNEQLLSAARRLGSAETVDEVGAAAANAVRAIAESDVAALALWDPASRELTVAAVAGVAPALPVVGGVTRAADAPELAALAADPKPLLIRADQASEWLRGLFGRYGTSALAALPILSGGELRGLLVGYWVRPSSPEVLTGRGVSRLGGLAALCAVALDNVRLLEAARRLGERDVLTGLGNRAFLDQRLVEAVTAVGEDDSVGVVYCDLDGFKGLNERLGHLGGDLVLREVGARIRGVIAEEAVVARPGGDEFVVVLPRVRTDAEVRAVVEAMGEALRAPIEVDGRPVHVTMSTGTAVGGPPVSLAAAELAQALLRDADAAMYEAKKRRRARRRRRGPDEARLDADLHGAVARGEVLALFQPQIELRTGRIVGCEVLARWQHPEFGHLLPADFIPLAEDNGTIGEIGAFVVDEACRVARLAEDRGLPLAVSVNLSTRELEDPAYLEDFLAAFDRHACPPERLTVEVTEADLVTDRAAVGRVLRLLRERGVGVSIDHFGTGSSSLAQLLELPATELKVDRSFVGRAGAVGAGIMTAIMSLARELRLCVVAEGVETKEQLDAAADAGCNRAQGPAVAAAGTAEELLARLAPDGAD